MKEDYPRTLLEFETRFATEEACREYLVQLRWPDGFVCPRCKGETAWLGTRGRGADAVAPAVEERARTEGIGSSRAHRPGGGGRRVDPGHTSGMRFRDRAETTSENWRPDLGEVWSIRLSKTVVIVPTLINPRVQGFDICGTPKGQAVAGFSFKSAV